MSLEFHTPFPFLHGEPIEAPRHRVAAPSLSKNRRFDASTGSATAELSDRTRSEPVEGPKHRGVVANFLIFL